ncbi:hypothetical protein [Paenibacillus sp. XY044]|uniref:hypothetical protein n=1 Tax=Paenibacillus sp. XY044 TaxID=2026089 RepID=UPI000B97D051|nr:hypothetical protein [Paenibacillus sp. XY044]OZB96790.1 hypothetical protein CJP46_13140 [Paenibacillus sp. XY044]
MRIISLALKVMAMTCAVSCAWPVAGTVIPQSAAAVSSAAVKTASPVRTALIRFTSASDMQAVPAPLKNFADSVVRELSAQSNFQQWSGAAIDYYPLGPGTHSWLAIVSENGKQLGYLIFTAREEGGYMLSEYGSGPAIPYSSDALHDRLAEDALIPDQPGIPANVQIQAQYMAMLPVWKVILPGKPAMYIDALTLERLPGNAVSASSTPVSGTEIVTNQEGLHLKSSSAVAKQSGGDPYDDLLWMTSPRLNISRGDDLLKAVTSGGSLIFTAPGRNASYGAPFAVTGVQIWSPSTSAPAVSYAATGRAGSRYLPVSMLMAAGEFHARP